MSLITPKANETLLPSWEINLPTIIPNSEAMLLSIISGVLATKFNQRLAVELSKRLEYI